MIAEKLARGTNVGMPQWAGSGSVGYDGGENLYEFVGSSPVANCDWIGLLSIKMVGEGPSAFSLGKGLDGIYLGVYAERDAGEKGAAGKEEDDWPILSHLTIEGKVDGKDIKMNEWFWDKSKPWSAADAAMFKVIHDAYGGKGKYKSEKELATAINWGWQAEQVNNDKLADIVFDPALKKEERAKKISAMYSVDLFGRYYDTHDGGQILFYDKEVEKKEAYFNPVNVEMKGGKNQAGELTFTWVAQAIDEKAFNGLGGLKWTKGPADDTVISWPERAHKPHIDNDAFLAGIKGNAALVGLEATFNDSTVNAGKHKVYIKVHVAWDAKGITTFTTESNLPLKVGTERRDYEHQDAPYMSGGKQNTVKGITTQSWSAK